MIRKNRIRLFQLVMIMSLVTCLLVFSSCKSQKYHKAVPCPCEKKRK